jgi:hypothetical protein
VYCKTTLCGRKVQTEVAALSASPRAPVVDYRTLPSSFCEIQRQQDDTAIYTIEPDNLVSRQIHASTCQLFCTVSDPLPSSLPSDVRKPPACRACGPAEVAAALRMPGRRGCRSQARGTKRVVELGMHEQAPEWSPHGEQQERQSRVRRVDRATTGDEDVVGLRERAAQHGSTADGSAGADWRRWAQTACATRLLCQLHFPTTVPVCPQLPCPRPFAITCAVPNEAPAPSRSPNTCVAAKLTHCASPILVPRSQTETACAQLLSPKNTHTRNSPPNHSSQWVSARLPCCLCQARQACVLRDFVVTSLLALP